MCCLVLLPSAALCRLPKDTTCSSASNHLYKPILTQHTTAQHSTAAVPTCLLCCPLLPSCRVPKDTICAIFAQENQYKVLKSHHIHKAHMDTYCSRCVCVCVGGGVGHGGGGAIV